MQGARGTRFFSPGWGSTCRRQHALQGFSRRSLCIPSVWSSWWPSKHLVMGTCSATRDLSGCTVITYNTWGESKRHGAIEPDHAISANVLKVGYPFLPFPEFSGGEVMIPGEGEDAQQKRHHRKCLSSWLETKGSHWHRGLAAHQTHGLPRGPLPPTLRGLGQLGKRWQGPCGAGTWGPWPERQVARPAWSGGAQPYFSETRATRREGVQTWPLLPLG